MADQDVDACKFTFYYTNLCTNRETFIRLGMMIKNYFGSDVEVVISNSWMYKGLVYDGDCLQLDDIKDWDKVFLFNFKQYEVSDYMDKIKYIGGNYLNRDNLSLTIWNVSLIFLDYSLLYVEDAFKNAIIPYQIGVSKLSSVGTFIDQETQFIDVAAMSCDEDYLVVLFKNVMQQSFLNENSRAVIAISPSEFNKINHLISIEEFLFHKIFPKEKKNIYTTPARIYSPKFENKIKFLSWYYLQLDGEFYNNDLVTEDFGLITRDLSWSRDSILIL